MGIRFKTPLHLEIEAMDSYFNESGNPIPFLQSDGFQYHRGPVYIRDDATEEKLIAATKPKQNDVIPYEPTSLSDFEF